MHCPTHNTTCMCCVIISFILMLIIQIWRTISEILNTKFCTFVCYKILLMPTQLYNPISLPSPKHKNELYANKHLIYV